METLSVPCRLPRLSTKRSKIYFPLLSRVLRHHAICRQGSRPSGISLKMGSVSAILKEILLKLLGTIFSFYAVYYIAASLLHGILRLDNFDGTIPFHYQSYTTIFINSTQWSNPVFLGDFISLECTYLTTPFVFFIFLSSRLWDYTITVTAVHCLLVCLVNLAFPLVWEWWVCIIISLLLSICLSELTSALIRKKKTGSFRPLQKEEDKVT